jgi:hypothetical protein
MQMNMSSADPDRRDFIRNGAVLGSALLGGAAWADDAALALAKAVHARPAGRDLTTLSRMELTEKGRAPRVRTLVTYRLDRNNGETANMMRFLEPEDIAGTGLLGVQKADGPTEQWLFLPALDRVRRIAGDRKGGRFVGSDLYFEDLEERKPSMDRHRLIGRETVAGVACEVLESVPVAASNSVYRRRVVWVDAANALALRVDYFERDDNTASKRWQLDVKRKIQNYWTAVESRVTDLGSGHETRMVIVRALYDRKLPERLFTSRALADEQLEAEFRP